MIECPQIGKVLDIDAPSNFAAGTKVQMWDKNFGENQIWTEEADGHITNPKSGRCLDISGGNRNNSAAIIIWDKHSSWNQKFKFTTNG
jgi:alpha-galactosidase